ncbi:poly(A)-specific ribonuclease PNLDC1-like [Heptranchias perlo]|uniref:poly(A)-specific ribonuclease PNLDC1-like n=1 Tax=Heptranchias perlo TaxID=212740 RepID=UPI00355AA765
MADQGGIFEPRSPLIGEYLATVQPHSNNINLIRARVSFASLSGADPVAQRPPILLVKVRRGWNSSTAEIAKEFATFCSLDVRQEGPGHYLLATNEWKGARKILRTYKAHPVFRVEPYRYWSHSPTATSAFRVCCSVATASLLVFLLSRAG